MHDLEGKDAAHYTEEESRSSAVLRPWSIVAEVAAARSAEVEDRDFDLPGAVGNP